MRTQNNFLQKLANLKHKFQSIDANFKYDFPYKKLKVIGVTGTDGKTTTTSLIYHILKQNKFKVAFISTIKAQIGGKTLDTGLHVTTPEPWDVPKYLDMMVREGVEYVVLESTSQGLEQNRLWGVRFDSVAITNIKSDHLDYHKTWKNYASAKFQVIRKLNDNGLAVLNKDDEVAYKWLKEKTDRINGDGHINVKWVSKSDVKNYDYSLKGLGFDYKGVRFNVPLLGKYNLENSLMAINICNKYMGVSQIAKSITSFQTPKGRMELIQTKPFTAIIDFAHTPHALENALKSLQPLKTKTAKVIVVFGCAGKRDKKRREMGKVAAELADIIILTAEDPRTEKLFEVNNDIINYAQQRKGDVVERFADSKAYKGMQLSKIQLEISDVEMSGKKPIITFDEDTVMSRIDAIHLAVKLAKKDDIVFLTGKAHEESLCFGEKEYPWDEHKTLRKVLESTSIKS